MISLSRQSHDKIGVKSIRLHNHVQGNKYTSRICWISLNMWEYLPGPVYPVIHLNHHKPSWKEPQGWEAWNWHWRCWDSFPIHNKRLSCRIGNSARRETGIPTFWPPQLVLCTFKEVDYSWIGPVKIETCSNQSVAVQMWGKPLKVINERCYWRIEDDSDSDIVVNIEEIKEQQKVSFTLLMLAGNEQ